MSAHDAMNPDQFFHGTGKAFAPGDKLDDAHGSGLWITPNRQAASHYARLNAMGRREYFGDASASPHVYQVEPGELQPKSTGFTAKSATVIKEAKYELPYKSHDNDWDEYTRKTPPAVLGDD